MIFRHCTNIVRQAVGEELLLLDQHAGRLHRLNPTAAWIYERCNGLSVDAVAEELAAHFDVDLVAAHRDVSTTTQQLIELGLIRIEAAD